LAKKDLKQIHSLSIGNMGFLCYVLILVVVLLIDLAVWK